MSACFNLRMLLAAAALLVVTACSSGDSGGTPAGTTGPVGMSALTASGGGGVNADPNCTSANAKSGASCSVDCTIPCGFQWLGTKVCSCVHGAYAVCRCPRPVPWGGADKAPTCDVVVPSNTAGLASSLKNTACDTEWAE